MSSAARRECISAACALLAQRRAPADAGGRWLSEAEATLEETYASVGHQLLLDQPELTPEQLAELLEPCLEGIRDAAAAHARQHAARSLRQLLNRPADRPTPPAPPAGARP